MGFSGWCPFHRKKALSSLVTGRKRLLSWCHPCSALEKRPLAFCCGKGTAPVSGPAGGAVSRPPAAGPSSQGTLLWCGGVNGTCSVRAVSAPTILSRKGGKVNPYSVSGTKNTLPQLPVGSPSTISMDTAGFSLVRITPPSVVRMGQQSSA